MTLERRLDDATLAAWEQKYSTLLEMFHQEKFHAPIGDGCGFCDLWHIFKELIAEIRRLRATLKAVCEDAFADECPKDGKCDTYGHAEECGAVSAAAHAQNLTRNLVASKEEIRRLREGRDECL